MTFTSTTFPCGTSKKNRYAVVIAGGAGERFWPASRIERPKHLWDITGSGACLLEQSFRRLSRIVPEENILIVTNKEQVEGIKKYCPFISENRIFAEPEGRDTLAAVATGALLAELLGGNEDAVVAVFPSDHVISDEESFKRTAERAFAVAERGNFLVTIGIKPTYPATGFGYIQAGLAFDGGGNARGFDVLKFHEKPSPDAAQRYLDAGNFYWNAGMFFWKISSIREAIRKNAPEFSSIFLKIEERLKRSEPYARVFAEFYPKLEKKSVDFAVMEKADNVKVVPAEFDWDDVGTWTAAGRHLPHDENGNAFRGNVFSESSSGNIVFDASGRTTAVFGAKDLIVVHTDKVTLICPKSEAERLKTFVRGLPAEYR